jgi:GT2 family glycosyltransferase
MTSPSTAQTSIFAILVIYKKLPAESPTLATLLNAAKMASPGLRLFIQIADNTPGGQDAGAIPEGVAYYAAPDNPGLAKPYNDALAQAEREGFTWLLTLDQDTKLPEDFLAAMERYVRQYESMDRVAGIVPRIEDNGRLISPWRMLGGFLPWILAPGTDGVSKRFTSALNSSSLLRVAALRSLGGYDVRFPLHNSDTSLFYRLDLAGKRLVVAGDILVRHELAILNREARTTPERYCRLLIDECDFWDRHMSWTGRAERLVRLAGRVCKGYLRHEDPVFQSITLREIGRRLSTRRRDRLKASDEAFASR